MPNAQTIISAYECDVCGFVTFAAAAGAPAAVAPSGCPACQARGRKILGTLRLHGGLGDPAARAGYWLLAASFIIPAPVGLIVPAGHEPVAVLHRLFTTPGRAAAWMTAEIQSPGVELVSATIARLALDDTTGVRTTARELGGPSNGASGAV